MCGVWLGKFAAIVAAAAVSLAAAMATLFCVADMGGDCVRLMPPVLPTIAEESRAEYDRFMAAPETPAEVKKQPRAFRVSRMAGSVKTRLTPVWASSKFPSIAQTPTFSPSWVII